MVKYIYKNIPEITTPDDDEVVWRYFDHWKFHLLLQKQALAFCRGDQLGDPFEGSYPLGNIIEREDSLNKGFAPDGRDTVYDDCADGIGFYKAFNEAHRYNVFINCWCMSESESAAMWNLYIKDKTGVAIKTTIGKLKKSLVNNEVTDSKPEEIYIGKVNYIDYQDENCKIPQNPEIDSQKFFYKMKSYEHEKEVRLFIGPLHSDDSKNIKETKTHRFVPVDLDLLIENIYIHPEAPEPYEELVKATVQDCKLNVIPQRTDLHERPLF